MSESLIATAEANASCQPNGHRPLLVRLPKPGTLCQWTGLSRSKLNELILPAPLNRYRPPVKSISLRNRGQVRGVRLISLDSLLSYLQTLEEQQQAELDSYTETFQAAYQPADQEPIQPVGSTRGVTAPRAAGISVNRNPEACASAAS